jgi:type I restriction enzyme S subunit
VTKLKPYPAYKDSHVQWIGSVPTEWAVEPGAHRLRVAKEIVGERHPDYDRLSLTMNGVLPRSKTDRDGLSPSSFATYQVLRPGQLVFKLIDLENRATSRVGISDALGLVSSAYIAADVQRGWHPRYAYYFYMALYLEGIFNVLGSGVRSTLNSDDLRSLRVPVPPKGEQKSIIAFLDRETAEIDEFITDQEKLVNLLRERRILVLLHQTLGLELGIPARLGRFVRKESRPVLGPNVITAFRDGQVTARANRRDEGFTMSESDAGYQGVAAGDLVFHGLDGFSGAVGVSDSTGKCSPVYHVCSTMEDVDPSYMALHLRALGVSGFLEAYAWSVRQRSVDYRNWATFSKLPLALPRLDVQRASVIDVASAFAEIDLAISDAREAIALSRERRAALISAAVTGKIDVREHAHSKS